MSRVTEATILKRLKTSAKARGLRVLRMSLRQGVEVGWPDTLILGPAADVLLPTLFIETKAPGKPLKPIQEERRREIETRGGLYAKADSIEDVEAALETFAQFCKAIIEAK